MLEDIEETITEIRRREEGAKILLDLPGNKVRTKDVSGIELKKFAGWWIKLVHKKWQLI